MAETKSRGMRESSIDCRSPNKRARLPTSTSHIGSEQLQSNNINDNQQACRVGNGTKKSHDIGQSSSSEVSHKHNQHARDQACDYGQRKFPPSTSQFTTPRQAYQGNDDSRLPNTNDSANQESRAIAQARIANKRKVLSPSAVALQQQQGKQQLGSSAVLPDCKDGAKQPAHADAKPQTGNKLRVFPTSKSQQEQQKHQRKQKLEQQQDEEEEDNDGEEQREQRQGSSVDSLNSNVGGNNTSDNEDINDDDPQAENVPHQDHDYDDHRNDDDDDGHECAHGCDHNGSDQQELAEQGEQQEEEQEEEPKEHKGEQQLAQQFKQLKQELQQLKQQIQMQHEERLQEDDIWEDIVNTLTCGSELHKAAFSQLRGSPQPFETAVVMLAALPDELRRRSQRTLRIWAARELHEQKARVSDHNVVDSDDDEEHRHEHACDSDDSDDMEMMSGRETMDVRYWDKLYSQNYRKGDNAEYLLSHSTVAPFLTDTMNSCLEAKDSVLVPGCGDSYFSVGLRDMGFPEVVSTDISEAAIQIMEHKFGEELGMEWMVDDASSMSFAQNCFGAIVDKSLIDCIMWVEDSEMDVDQTLSKVFSEYHRVLMPGRNCVVLTIRPPEELAFYFDPDTAPPAHVLEKRAEKTEDVLREMVPKRWECRTQILRIVGQDGDPLLVARDTEAVDVTGLDPADDPPAARRFYLYTLCKHEVDDADAHDDKDDDDCDDDKGDGAETDKS